MRKNRRRISPWRLAAVILATVVLVTFTVYTAMSMIGSFAGMGGSNLYSWAAKPIGENEYADKLKTAYAGSQALETITENIDAYPTTLLDALLRNPEILDFVMGYLDHRQYGFENAENIDVAVDYAPGEIPLFLQWDERWGYEDYGTDLMALNGCGPTCMAMIYVGLTGDTTENPLSIAEMCIENGYYYAGQGTSTELITYGVRHLSLRSAQLTATPEAVLESLNAGRPVMVNVGPGDFTIYGHYIVLTGVDENGRIILNDPNSRENSAKTWDLDRIIEQSFTVWSVWKA